MSELTELPEFRNTRLRVVEKRTNGIFKRREALVLAFTIRGVRATAMECPLEVVITRGSDRAQLKIESPLNVQPLVDLVGCHVRSVHVQSWPPGKYGAPLERPVALHVEMEERSEHIEGLVTDILHVIVRAKVLEGNERSREWGRLALDPW